MLKYFLILVFCIWNYNVFSQSNYFDSVYVYSSKYPIKTRWHGSACSYICLTNIPKGKNGFFKKARLVNKKDLDTISIILNNNLLEKCFEGSLLKSKVCIEVWKNGNFLLYALDIKRGRYYYHNGYVYKENNKLYSIVKKYIAISVKLDIRKNSLKGFPCEY